MELNLQKEELWQAVLGELEVNLSKPNFIKKMIFRQSFRCLL